MAINLIYNSKKLGVGDSVKVYQKITEGKKHRTQIFEGMIIRIKGSGITKSITVRRIGSAQIGIEKIFPISSPTIQDIKRTKIYTKGVKRAKLYYTRDKSVKELRKLQTRSTRRKVNAKVTKKPIKPKKSAERKKGGRVGTKNTQK